MTAHDNPELRLLITIKDGRKDNLSSNYVTFHAEFCYPSPEPRFGEVRFFIDSGYSFEFPGLRFYLPNLAVTAQADTDNDSPWYAVNVEYSQPHSVGLAQAEKMVATLRKIERGVHRLEDRFGRAQDVTQTVAYLSQVVGVERYGWRTKLGNFNVPNEYRWTTDIENVRYHINDSLARARKREDVL